MITAPIIINTISTVIIGIVLLYASIEDIQSRTIRAVWVVVLYILISIQSVATNSLNIESTYVFIFSLVLFMLMAILSRGQFGIGDALVIGAFGWYYHTFHNFQVFLFIMGIIGIPWAIYWTWHYRKKYGQKYKKTINIDEAQPGMVLEKDNFMNGITKKDIETWKLNGLTTLNVKQPFPFIPVIFIAFFLTFLF